jgi:hypothetical protein
MQVASALDLPSPDSFHDPEIELQPMGHTLSVIQSLYSSMNDELTNKALPQLREFLGEIGKTMSKFDLFQNRSWLTFAVWHSSI